MFRVVGGTAALGARRTSPALCQIVKVDAASVGPGCKGSRWGMHGSDMHALLLSRGPSICKWDQHVLDLPTVRSRILSRRISRPRALRPLIQTAGA